jgi:DNA-binding CsgD family transcriptional regulator/tetratricopeptide (TPR) repeat protein
MPERGTPFVGRQHEVSVLLDHLTAAGRGDGGLVLVAGEPGIGKTRLLSELATRARATGWRVLLGRAYESEGMPPYLPFVEALRAYLLTCSLDELGPALGRGAAEVARLLPEVRDYLPELEAGAPLGPDAERYRLYESVADFLLNIARAPAHPALLICLDDLHWADTPSLLLLRHVARRLAGSPLLIVGTFRTVELGRTHPLADTLAELRREGLSERLTLGALSQADTATLVAALSGVAPASAVADAVYRETEGNPFFVGELVRHLLTEGRDPTDAEATVSPWGVPEGVREVIGRRLARLSAEANRLLEVAAVLGEGSRPDVIEMVSELGEAVLPDALDEALGAGMLREEGGGYHFTHALIRQTVYDGLNLPRRQRLHLRAARAIEQVCARDLAPHWAALAVHYRLAGPAADPERAVDYALRAGESAAAVYAWEEAVAHRRAALELLAPGDEAGRHELLLALGDAQLKAGDRPQARETFQQAAAHARRLGDPERLARTALGLGGTGNEPSLVHQPLVDLLRESLDALPAGDSVLRARLLARLAVELRLDEVRARRTTLSDEAAAMAERVGDRRALVVALQARTMAVHNQFAAEDTRATASALVRLGEAMGDRERALEGRLFLLWNSLWRGDFATMEAEFADFARLTEELRQPFYLWWTAGHHAMLALLGGRFAEAETLAGEARALGQRTRSEAAERGYWWQIFAIRREQGRLAEVADELRAIARQFPSQEPWQCLMPLLDCELDNAAEARSALERIFAEMFQGLRSLDTTSMTAALLFAQVCAHLGDRTRADALYDLLLPYSGNTPPTHPPFCVCTGPVSRYLGLLAATLGRWAEAATHFDDALAMHIRTDARPLLAHTRREYAAMLLARLEAEGRGRPGDGTAGIAARARELLDGAAALYDELEMEHFAARARALLADSALAGVTPARSAYPDGLSEREVEVLRLLAAGRSNREIGAELVLSVRTVERHIANIYLKTDTHTRTRATLYALEHHLV